MRGRKPKPTAEKRLTGNPGKRPLNDSEPELPVPDATPRVPAHLGREARKEWRRLVKVLKRAGLYSVADRAALAMYCQAWGRWVEAERRVREDGEVLESCRGGLYQNPWLHVANKAWDQMRRILVEFGMTPSSRSRIKAVPPRDRRSLAEMLWDGAQVLDE